MRLKIDENLPQDVARLLRDAGHDAASVFDQGMSGDADPFVYAICQQERRVLMTLDLDFANVQAYPPGASAGIIVLRLARQDRPSVMAVVRRLLPMLESETLRGRLWIVEEERVRIRE